MEGKKRDWAGISATGMAVAFLSLLKNGLSVGVLRRLASLKKENLFPVMQYTGLAAVR